jgi:hypothetical protein
MTMDVSSISDILTKDYISIAAACLQSIPPTSPLELEAASLTYDVPLKHGITLHSLCKACNVSAQPAESEGTKSSDDLKIRFASVLCDTEFGDTPVSTPRRNNCLAATTPPPREQMPIPMLMRALQANSAALVQEAIRADPEVSRFPFWDHKFEPPLCFAVRRKCKVEILELLLQHGADLDATDIHGQTPASILKKMHSKQRTSDHEYFSAAATLLHANLVGPLALQAQNLQMFPDNLFEEMEGPIINGRDDDVIIFSEDFFTGLDFSKFPPCVRSVR